VFALGKLLGAYELALVGVGAALVGLTYDVSARALDDRRVGLLAAGFLLCSPLFVVQSGTFLPYAPTAALNLGFAAAFLRADRTGSLRWGALAGVLSGLAFFSRPYTAVLFATPFIAAALYDLATDFRGKLARHGATALTGLAGVALTLSYNAVVTGEAFTFPYAAFAPLDGLGFGRRRLLGHELEYTPEIALESNRLAVEYLLTEWVAAGAAGTVLAALGAILAARRVRTGRLPRRGPALLAGVLCSVVAGNLYFWGTYNALGDLGEAGDGLVNFLGPYYHFDALLPLAAFGGVGALALAGWVRRRIDYWLPERRQAAVVACLLVAALVSGGLAAGALAEPIEENGTVTGEYRAAYAPFEADPPGEAVVFVPDTYGPWLNHPFQALRNDPDFDSGPVYALDYDEENFAVLDSFPDRPVERFVYRGVWNPADGNPVVSRLQPVEDASGERIEQRVRVGLPERADSVSLRLGVENGGAAYYTAEATGEALPVTVTMGNGTAALSGPVEPTGEANGTLALDGETEVELTVFADVAPGNRLTYRFTTPVVAEGGTVRALTHDIGACQVARRCGDAAGYVPNASGLPRWASVESELHVV
jgi:hypothetical protein